jgi:hypothetical protein
VPLVIDVVDNVGLFAGMARTRQRWYRTAKVAEVRDCAVEHSGEYEIVKPSSVVREWLTEEDPWNK